MTGNHADRTTRRRRSAGLALLAAFTAIALAGCGGSAPPVANVATRTSSGAGGDPARLLDEWAACMRAHGDPNQIDPTIDSHKDIEITWSPAVPGGYNGTNKGGQGNAGPGQYCRRYLGEAQSALRGGRPLERPSTAQLVRFSRCMRSHGIRDFPDPPATGGLQINMGGDLSPGNPAFESASKTCSKETGVAGLGSGGLPPGVVRVSGS